MKRKKKTRTELGGSSLCYKFSELSEIQTAYMLRRYCTNTEKEGEGRERRKRRRKDFSLLVAAERRKRCRNMFAVRN